MNTCLNYILEANIGLLALLLFYKLLLAGETDFSVLRLLLLTGICVSLLFPLIHIGPNPEVINPLSISRVIPTYWLPEVVVGTSGSEPLHEGSFNFWKYTTLLYAAGSIIAFLIVVFQLQRLFILIRNSETYRLNKLRIAESREDKPTFSFFHFIFIGKADQLSTDEKQQIIRHESVHAMQWHSLDILLMNALKIFFWFNPFINTYKKIFIQLHEFEADARAVADSDVNKYCSLLAKVALQSADFSLASHFNYSLTVKRIEMMRTIKSNVKRWKLAAMFATLPLLFFFVACQDQVADDMTEIARNSSHALQVPAHIQARYEQLKRDNPDKKYALLELNETASQKLEELRGQYGLPKSMEVFTTVDGKVVGDPIKGRSEDGAGVVERRPIDPGSPLINGSDMVARQTGLPVQNKETFAIIEFNEQTSEVAEASQQDRIYTVVEEAPEFPGGYDSMMVFIRENLRYPTEARMQGIEGTVYISFIVGKDGTVSDAKIIRGISPEADGEALRVVQLSPPWIPGRQNKEVVSVRFVLPIKFALSN